MESRDEESCRPAGIVVNPGEQINAVFCACHMRNSDARGGQHKANAASVVAITMELLSSLFRPHPHAAGTAFPPTSRGGAASVAAVNFPHRLPDASTWDVNDARQHQQDVPQDGLVVLLEERLVHLALFIQILLS